MLDAAPRRDLLAVAGGAPLPHALIEIEAALLAPSHALTQDDRGVLAIGHRGRIELREVDAHALGSQLLDPGVERLPVPEREYRPCDRERDDQGAQPTRSAKQPATHRSTGSVQ